MRRPDLRGALRDAARSPFWLDSVLPVLAGAAVASVLLLVPPPGGFAREMKAGTPWPAALLTLGILYPLLRVRGGWARPASIVAGVALFALPLAGLWHTALTDLSSIGGFIPFSDAASYYTEASAVLERRGFSTFSARRPIFPGFLAALLGLSQGNLWVVLGGFAVCAGIAATLAARTVLRSAGPAAAAVIYWLALHYYGRFAGTTLTEQIGLPLGLLAFAMLWRAAEASDRLLAIGGIFVLTIALNARAGTFFVLPMLALWAAREMRDHASDRFGSRTVLLQGIAVVAIGFVANWILFKLLARPGTLPFSNFSYTLYGVAAGGTSWQQVLIDYPELRQLSEADQAKRVFVLAADLIVSHPGRFVWGSGKALFEMVLPYQNRGIFSYVNSIPLQLAVCAATVIALYRMPRQRSHPVHRMLFWSLGGIALSAPLVPLWDSDGMRAYAATIPFLMVLPALGVGSLGAIAAAVGAPPRHLSVRQLRVIGVAAAALVVLLPMAAWATATRSPAAEIACAPGDSSRIVRLERSAGLLLTADSSEPRRAVIPATRFVNELGPVADAHPHIRAAFESIQPPAVLALTADVRSGRWMWVTAAPEVAERLRRPTTLCLRDSIVPNLGLFMRIPHTAAAR